MNAEEELVLTEEDMIAHPPPPVAAVRPPAAPSIGAADEESIGDFEREPGSVLSSTSTARYSGAGSGEGRRVSIPIDLGALPRSGRVTLTVEIAIQIDSDEPAAKKPSSANKPDGFDDSFTRDLAPSR
jgi:hypothetical protein